MASIQDLSTTAGSNTSIGGISIAEGMTPGNVNNAHRLHLAWFKMYVDDNGAVVETSGSSNTYAATNKGSFETLATGVRMVVKANHTNTGAATLNVTPAGGSALGAKALRKITTAGEGDVAAGDLTDNGIYGVVYDSTANSAAGAWIVLNPTQQALGTGASPQFTTIELGHASDTTLSRSAAGKLAVEGVDVALLTGAQTLASKTLTSPVINSGTIGTSLVPTNDDGAALGSTSKQFSDLFLASGGAINWNNNGITISESSDLLLFNGASLGYAFSTTIYPAVNDSGALGTSDLNWSDLFLASGAVINFNAGNVTLTHSAGNLALAGSATDVVLDLSNAAAGQIAFPSSQNASAGANTLDDYEEGTFTPTYATTGTDFSGVTYDRQSGIYTKVGRSLFFTLVLRTDGYTGSPTGSIVVNGMPFTANNSATDLRAPIALTGFSFATNRPSIGIITNNTTQMSLHYISATNADPANLAVADFSNSANSNLLWCNGTYTVA